MAVEKLKAFGDEQVEHGFVPVEQDGVQATRASGSLCGARQGQPNLLLESAKPFPETAVDFTLTRQVALLEDAHHRVDSRKDIPGLGLLEAQSRGGGRGSPDL